MKTKAKVTTKQGKDAKMVMRTFHKAVIGKLFPATMDSLVAICNGNVPTLMALCAQLGFEFKSEKNGSILLVLPIELKAELWKDVLESGQIPMNQAA